MQTRVLLVQLGYWTIFLLHNHQEMITKNLQEFLDPLGLYFTFESSIWKRKKQGNQSAFILKKKKKKD